MAALYLDVQMTDLRQLGRSSSWHRCAASDWELVEWCTHHPTMVRMWGSSCPCCSALTAFVTRVCMLQVSACRVLDAHRVRRAVDRDIALRSLGTLRMR